MDEGTRIVVVGLAAPAVIGAIAGVAALRPGLPPGAGKLSPADMLAWMSGPVRVGLGSSIAAVLAMGAGLYVSQVGVHGEIVWPPASMDDRIRVLAVVLGIGAVLGAFVLHAARAGALGAGALAFILGVCGAGAVMWPRIRPGESAAHDGWPVGYRAAVLGLFGLWSLAIAWPLIDLLGRGRRVSSGMILGGMALAVGGALAGTGSLKLGTYGLGFAAACLGLLVGMVVRRGAAIGPAAVALATGTFAAYMAAGWAYSSTPPWVCVVLACAAPAAWIADRAIGTRVGVLGGGLVRIGAAATVAGIAVAPGVTELATFADERPADPYAGSVPP